MGDISPGRLPLRAIVEAPGGRALLLAAHEISGTTSVMELDTDRR
ncbi:MAG: hypothetical protein R2755_22075 [Acidimicrobiales bacterium]